MGTVILGPVSGTEVAVPNQTGWQIFASGTPSIVTQPVVKGVGSIVSAMSSASSSVSSNLRASAGLGAVQHAAVGQKVALQVTVEANPLPTYQWYLGGAPIAGAKSAIYFVPTITANVGAQFIYSVSASNGTRAQDTVQSDSVMIRVDALPDPVVAAVPALKTGQTQYANGADITLLANISDNQALYSYQWKKSGVPIFGATGPSLLLAKAGSEQSGNYSVVVTGVSMARESLAKTISIAKPALSKPDVLYPVTFQNTSSVRGFLCNPTLTVLTKPSDPTVPYTYGATAGTRITLSGVAPTGQYLQNWQVKDASGNVLTTLAPRSGTFIMPSQPVFITPTVTRPYSGTYS
jgi:hypothetical protein